MIFETYDLEPGDTVHIDAGTYFLLETINVPPEDGGSSEGWVTIRGAGAAGDSRTLVHCLLRDGWDAAIRLDHVEYVECADLAVRGGDFGVHGYYSGHSRLSGLRVYDAVTHGINLYPAGGTSSVSNVVVHECGGIGIYARPDTYGSGSPKSFTVDNALVYDCGNRAFVAEGGSCAVRTSTFISSTGPAVTAADGTLDLASSILAVSAPDVPCLRVTAICNDTWVTSTASSRRTTRPSASTTAP